MQFLKKSAPFGVLLAVLFLAACQTTSTTPVAAGQVPSLISAVWEGHFINRQGSRFPVSFDLTGKDGKLAGQAHVPDSSYLSSISSASSRASAFLIAPHLCA